MGARNTVNFWHDPWITSCGPLISHVQGEVPTHLAGMRVCDLVNSMGEWELEFIEEWLPSSICGIISCFPPPRDLGRPDILAWKPTHDGEFSVRSVYGVVAPCQFKSDPPIFHFIWNWVGPERIKVLLWRVTKNAILTNEARSRRGLSLDSSCPRCSSCPGTIPHVLRDCAIATAVWMEVFHLPASDSFFHSNFSLWL